MKKAMTIGLAALLVAGAAIAQDDVVMVGQMDSGSETSQTEVTGQISLFSSYVWRGQVLNNDFVVQPELRATQYGFTVGVWGNYDLGENYAGVSSDFSEIDIALAYRIPLNINDLQIDVGAISYNYPNTTSGLSARESTTELFARATALTWQDYVIPSVTFYGDVDEANGTYILFDIYAPYQISDYLAVMGGISAGWGNTSYNDYYWGSPSEPTHDAGWNDYNFYGNASYEIAENLSASLNLTYTVLEGGSIGNSDAYEAKEKFWGGVGIAYDF